MSDPRKTGLRRLQMRTLATLWAKRPKTASQGYGLNACDFGGERYAACARTLAKYGLVRVETISPRHKRYSITSEGVGVALRYASTAEALAARSGGSEGTLVATVVEGEGSREAISQ